MLSVESLVIRQCVSVKQALLVIRFRNVTKFGKIFRKSLYNLVHPIHVVRMLYAESRMVPALVYVFPNILAILMRAVDLNVFSTRTVHQILHVCATSVQILVLALVLRTQSVKLLFIYPLVHASLIILGIHSVTALHNSENVRKTTNINININLQ